MERRLDLLIQQNEIIIRLLIKIAKANGKNVQLDEMQLTNLMNMKGYYE